MKKDATVVVHLPESQQAQFRALAELEGTDLSGLGRKLIIDYLAVKKTQFDSMRGIFDSQENFEN